MGCRGSVTSGTWPCNFPRRPFKKNKRKLHSLLNRKRQPPSKLIQPFFFLTIEFRTLPQANSSLDLPCRGSVTSGTWPCNFPRRPFKKKQKKQMKTTFSPESKKTTPTEIDSAVFF